MLSIVDIIESKYPNFTKKYPKLLVVTITRILEKIICQDEVNGCYEKIKHLHGLQFIDGTLDLLLNNKINVIGKDKIPKTGPLICVSNHPLGALDALLLLKHLSEVRSDLKIVANDILMRIHNIKDFFLPYNVYKKKGRQQTIEKIHASLKNNEAIILFPSGDVAQMTRWGIRERPWSSSPIYFAKKHGAPILPMYVHAKNSFLFYLVSLLGSHAATLMYPRELVYPRKSPIDLLIGDAIDSTLLSDSKMLQKMVFNLRS